MVQAINKYMQIWGDAYNNEGSLLLHEDAKERIAILADRLGCEEVDLALQLLLNGLRVAESTAGFVAMMQLMDSVTSYTEFDVMHYGGWSLDDDQNN